MLFLFHRKGSTELVAYTRSSLRLCWKISTLTLRTATLQVVFSAQILCMLALRYLCLARKKESAYSDLWTHKKNVTMDKQKVNTTSSTDRKGYSSSSHYRISSGLEECVHEGKLNIARDLLIGVNDRMHFDSPFLFAPLGVPSHTFEYQVREQRYGG